LRVICYILAFLIFITPLFAQENEPPVSEAQAMLQETTQAQPEVLITEDAYLDNLTPQQRFEQDPKHNVHEYNYKQQVIVGGVVMFCVALAMIANNNYNPKPGR
jgi:hypothetical protein